MYEIQIKNLAEIQKLFEQYPRESAVHFGEAISQTLITAQRYAIQGAPRDTGKLMASWRLNVGIMRGELVNTTSYAYWVAVGRRPGSWPPMKEITKWANRKGIPPFLVARKIKEKGTEPNPFFDNAVKLAEVYSEVAFKTAMEKTIKSIVK